MTSQEKHELKPCPLCIGLQNDIDFDYCRSCGFTITKPEKQLLKELSPLEKAIRKARGGEAPIQTRGFA
jgi:hypothetical protein